MCKCAENECLKPHRDSFKCVAIDSSHPYGGVKLAFASVYHQDAEPILCQTMLGLSDALTWKKMARMHKTQLSRQLLRLGLPRRRTCHAAVHVAHVQFLGKQRAPPVVSSA